MSARLTLVEWGGLVLARVPWVGDLLRDAPVLEVGWVIPPVPERAGELDVHDREDFVVDVCG